MHIFTYNLSDRSAEETALRRILGCCDENDIQISFDIVRYLYQDSCNGNNNRPYPGF